MRAPETLTDGVIRLGPYALTDARAHAAGEDREMRLRFDAPDPDVAPSIEHVRSVIQRWIAARDDPGLDVTYAIRPALGDDLLGGCELRRPTPHCARVSYWVFPAHRGRGHAVRALGLLVRAAVGLPGVGRIEAHIDADDTASRRTAETAGFAQDGEAEGRLRYVRRL